LEQVFCKDNRFTFMTFFFRYFLPFSYFKSTRLFNLNYAAYHILLEGVPVLLLTLIYSNYSVNALSTALLSYLAFICIYEIGYITNDFYSEKFEEDPRGRSKDKNVALLIIWSLIIVKTIFFLLFSYLLGSLNNFIWWTFHIMLMMTFIFHNIRMKEYRLSTFFSLSVFRFMAPLVLCLPGEIFLFLSSVVMLNYSLFRVITYGVNKNLIEISNRDTTKFKFVYYINCLPLNVLLSVSYRSFLPIIFCLYYIFLWIICSKMRISSTQHEMVRFSSV